MNVSLTPELEQFVMKKVETGMYQTASEVVRESLRLLREPQGVPDMPPVVRTQKAEDDLVEMNLAQESVAWSSSDTFFSIG
jgi:putative addiction module CopG family antidote